MAALIRLISITEFKQRCHEVVRKVERTGKPVTITRRGRVVAQLEPGGGKPWERMRGRGKWLASAGETLIKELRPHRGPRAKSLIGLHKGRIKIRGDIISPIGTELWEALE